MKGKWLYFVLPVLLILGLEAFLRLYLGFGDAVLLAEDPQYEYIANPNQTRFRFRNHIRYNSKSMRSEEIDSASTVILGFGDSVINGGALTDNDSLATTRLSKKLSEIEGKKVQFLNISAGSWGPDNCYAYLEKYGSFGAKSIFLFVSSHDAYDNMNFEKVVNVSKNLPSTQYLISVYELIDRYLIPRAKEILHWPEAETGFVIDKKKYNSGFNTGFKSFLDYSKSMKIPLTIYLHADMDELAAKKYNEQGEKIIQFAKEHRVNIIADLDNGLSESDFRDYIHINSKGQKDLAGTVLNYLRD